MWFCTEELASTQEAHDGRVFRMNPSGAKVNPGVPARL